MIGSRMVGRFVFGVLALVYLLAFQNCAPMSDVSFNGAHEGSQSSLEAEVTPPVDEEISELPATSPSPIKCVVKFTDYPPDQGYIVSAGLTVEACLAAGQTNYQSNNGRRRVAVYHFTLEQLGVVPGSTDELVAAALSRLHPIKTY